MSSRTATVTCSQRGSVLVVGPDGAGKTTVADAVEVLARGAGALVTRAHYRPGVLLGQSGDGAPVTDPHSEPPRGLATAVPKLMVVVADFLAGSVTRWRRARRDGLLILERGWHDQVVDPRRYRIPAALVSATRAAGRLVPKADVVVLLAGDPDAIVARKPEIEVTEVKRQQEAWRELAPRAGHKVLELDAVNSTPEQIASVVIDALTRSRRWRRAPLAPRRLDLRATTDPTALSALSIYRPALPRARAASQANRVLLRAGIGTSIETPIDGLDDLATTIGITADGFASMRSPQPGRFVIGIASNGHLRTVVKLGHLDDSNLRREGEALQSLAGSEIKVPRLVWSGEWRDHFAVATEAIPNDGRSPRLDGQDVLDIAISLAHAKVVHGDFASWNFLGPKHDLTLLDWEASHDGLEPLHDLAHFVVQEGALLRRYGPDRAIDLLVGPESPGSRYLTALGLDLTRGREMLITYLERRVAAHTSEPYATKMLGRVA